MSKLTQNIPEILAKYAGDDGVFSAQEFADFLNGAEWGAVMDAWHASSGRAKMEIQWIDDAQTSFHDGYVTKGEVKVGILNNLAYQGKNVDTQLIEELIDKYTGEDGTFSLQEYQKMKQDPKSKSFMEQYNVTPWFDPFENSGEKIRVLSTPLNFKKYIQLLHKVEHILYRSKSKTDMRNTAAMHK